MSLIRNILSERELRESLDLLNILSNHTALVPNQQTCQKYKWVLDNLNAVGRYWIYTEALNIGMTKDQANIVGGQILPFGSYALNVFESGNGLDAILLAPNFVTAEMFSQNFLSVLQGTPTVTMCVELLQESVPKITFVMDDVEIDLVFVSLMSAIVPDDLRQFDSRSLLYQNEYTNSGLDGIRLTDAILTNLPQESYFQITLRLVKLWAKNNGIYSSSMGYLGSASLAILVSKICQLHPNAGPRSLLELFFTTFGTWKWPQSVVTGPKLFAGAHPIHDPEIRYDVSNGGLAIMTPFYPTKNTIINVGMRAQQLVRLAFKRALDCVGLIAEEKAELRDLFVKFDFFEMYTKFLVVRASGLNENLHMIGRYFIGSHLRELAVGLEDQSYIRYCHLYPSMFQERGTFPTSDAFWVIGIQFLKPQIVDLNTLTTVFCTKLQNANSHVDHEFENANMHYVEAMGNTVFNSVIVNRGAIRGWLENFQEIPAFDDFDFPASR